MEEKISLKSAGMVEQWWNDTKRTIQTYGQVLGGSDAMEWIPPAADRNYQKGLTQSFACTSYLPTTHGRLVNNVIPFSRR
jgi:hypothetical protein